MKPDDQTFFVFSIATVPDVEAIRRVYSLPVDLSENEIAEFAWQRQRAINASAYLPPQLQKIVHIHACYRDAYSFRSMSFEGEERQVIQEFLDVYSHCKRAFYWPRFEKNQPTHVFPTLLCRAMMLGNSGLQMGVAEDLSVVLQQSLSLNEMAVLCDIPCSPERSQESLWKLYLEGRIFEISQENKKRAVAVYSLALRYFLLRGWLSAEICANELLLMKSV